MKNNFSSGYLTALVLVCAIIGTIDKDIIVILAGLSFSVLLLFEGD